MTDRLVKDKAYYKRVATAEARHEVSSGSSSVPLDTKAAGRCKEGNL